MSTDPCSTSSLTRTGPGGLPPFTAEQTAQHALSYADISPDVALFLMQMYDSAYNPAGVDIESEQARFAAASFILSAAGPAAGLPPT